MSTDTKHETVSDFTLSLTESAAKRVREIIVENGLPTTAGLRAGATSGGCSGYNYDVRIADAPERGDTVLERSPGGALGLGWCFGGRRHRAQ